MHCDLRELLIYLRNQRRLKGQEPYLYACCVILG